MKGRQECHDIENGQTRRFKLSLLLVMNPLIREHSHITKILQKYFPNSYMVSTPNSQSLLTPPFSARNFKSWSTFYSSLSPLNHSSHENKEGCDSNSLFSVLLLQSFTPNLSFQANFFICSFLLFSRSSPLLFSLPRRTT